jgi:c-di-GMP-binding flagellar brake protein YcgR
MVDEQVGERRRVARVPIAFAELLITFPIDIRLVDISETGVLLRSKHQVELGTKGTLRFNLGGQPFAASIEVARVKQIDGPGPERYAIGASFSSLDAEARHAIERFIEQ